MKQRQLYCCAGPRFRKPGVADAQASAKLVNERQYAAFGSACLGPRAGATVIIDVEAATASSAATDKLEKMLRIVSQVCEMGLRKTQMMQRFDDRRGDRPRY